MLLRCHLTALAHFWGSPSRVVCDAATHQHSGNIQYRAVAEHGNTAGEVQKAAVWGLQMPYFMSGHVHSPNVDLFFHWGISSCKNFKTVVGRMLSCMFCIY